MDADTNTPSPEAQRDLHALQTAVRDALERKRRLGQYAVIMRNGKIEYLDWRDAGREGKVGSQGAAMTKLDLAKEKIAYLKLWLGIAVVSDISLFTWLLTAGQHGSGWLVFFAWLGVVVITGVAFGMHKAIKAQIDSLEDL